MVANLWATLLLIILECTQLAADVHTAAAACTPSVDDGARRSEQLDAHARRVEELEVALRTKDAELAALEERLRAPGNVPQREEAIEEKVMSMPNCLCALFVLRDACDID